MKVQNVMILHEI